MHGCACHRTQMLTFGIFCRAQRYLGNRSKTLRVIDRVAPLTACPDVETFFRFFEWKKKSSSYPGQGRGEELRARISEIFLVRLNQRFADYFACKKKISDKSTRRLRLGVTHSNSRGKPPHHHRPATFLDKTDSSIFSLSLSDI